MTYFFFEEFACKCCGKSVVHPDLIIMLEVARKQAGVPFVINSGYRCKDNNKKVGGSETSSHLIGAAVDIDAPNSTYKYLIVRHCLDAGFRRIGVGSNFVHVDIDKNKVHPVIWTY